MTFIAVVSALTRSRSVTLSELKQANIQHASRSMADGFVPLHASAVDTAAGVVALSGRSGAGKSTFAAAAVQAGWLYVADEIAAVRPEDLTVASFHRPIGLRRGGAEVLGIEIGSHVSSMSMSVDPIRRSPGGRLAAVALLDRRPDGAGRIARLADAAALSELAQHMVIPDGHLASSFAGLDRIVRATTVVRFHYDSVAAGLDLLAELVERLRK